MDIIKTLYVVSKEFEGQDGLKELEKQNEGLYEPRMGLWVWRQDM